jgi:hypothetical protein
VSFAETLWFVLTGGPLEPAGPWPEDLMPLKAAPRRPPPARA